MYPHFPDSDAQYKGASSIKLMQHVVGLLNNCGYGILNVDATLVLQKPRIAPFIDDMRQNIARACSIDVDQVSVKATTTEKLGFPGREEGVAAHAMVLIEKERTE